MRFFHIDVEHVWGDSGNVLVHGSIGLHDELPSHAGPVSLERTGPVCPKLTLPGLHTLVVTDSFRKTLSKSPFDRIRFLPVNVAKVVDIPWQDFERDLDSAPKLENGVTAEHYFYRASHSANAASRMERLWQCVLEVGCKLQTVNQKSPWEYDVAIDLPSWNNDHLMLGMDESAVIGKWIVTTELGKQWFETHDVDWVVFTEIHPL